MTTLQDSAVTADREGEAAPAPETLYGRYSIVRKLGSGGMGTVFLVRDQEERGRLLALKVVRHGQLDARAIAGFKKEYLVLAALRHPNLARVYDFGIDKESGNFFFTTEFVDGVQLLEACTANNFSSRESTNLFLDVLVQILRVLEFIHAQGLIHGDIKPENILVTAGLSQAPGGRGRRGRPVRRARK